MRIDRALWVLALVLAPAAHAQAPALEVRLTPPAALHVGDRAEVLADVTITPAGDAPLIITPASEGAAVEVVRGRLLRADAEDPSATPLRFHVPIVARAAGAAVLRVHALGYACPAPSPRVRPRCRPLESTASLVLRVAD